jgi:hypothetical protein
MEPWRIRTRIGDRRSEAAGEPAGSRSRWSSSRLTSVSSSALRPRCSRSSGRRTTASSTTPRRRRGSAFCRAEVALNRRLAPDVYPGRVARCIEARRILADALRRDRGPCRAHEAAARRPERPSLLRRALSSRRTSSGSRTGWPLLPRGGALPETSGNVRASVEENFEQLGRSSAIRVGSTPR